MKVIWKKQNINSKKSSLAAVSHFPNLPFEHEEEDDDQAQQNHQTNYSTELEKHDEKDDGLSSQNQDLTKTLESHQGSDLSNAKQLAREFEAQGNKFAEEGKYREALGKWEAALTLMPENAVLHEQKVQILLEFGDSWQALKAATRATELESSWAEETQFHFWV
ncbi:tetratricopeptide repeat protein 33 [Quillaja saponaria]|uniref:Tetratricopeptide repeat protein 33 n=1 Tax=Quillaja saponaria TaxID=32244 RepID=A0AAD7PLL4_QUISA|nr:tetratricopeptide repeat protein 33 [Quillaja saponaria]